MKFLGSHLTLYFCLLSARSLAFSFVRNPVLSSRGCSLRPFASPAALSFRWKSSRSKRVHHPLLLHASHGSDESNDDTTFDPVPIMRPSGEDKEAFRVVPPDFASESPRTDVVIQPGLGWGDGKHPSTYMCLQFVWEQVSAKQEPSVLDYGTGSGVLAICAKKFGAGHVLGIDKDDEILEHAEDNARLNSVEDGLELLNGRELTPGSSGLYVANDFSAKTFDIVCANMLPAALVKLAPFISLGVKEESGILGLSGIRHEQVDDVKDAFAKHGIQFHSERRREGASPGAKWTEYVLLIGRRPKMTEAERAAYAEFLAESAVE